MNIGIVNNTDKIPKFMTNLKSASSLPQCSMIYIGYQGMLNIDIVDNQ